MLFNLSSFLKVSHVKRVHWRLADSCSFGHVAYRINIKLIQIIWYFSTSIAAVVVLTLKHLPVSILRCLHAHYSSVVSLLSLDGDSPKWWSMCGCIVFNLYAWAIFLNMSINTGQSLEEGLSVMCLVEDIPGWRTVILVILFVRSVLENGSLCQFAVYWR